MTGRHALHVGAPDGPTRATGWTIHWKPRHRADGPVSGPTGCPHTSCACLHPENIPEHCPCLPSGACCCCDRIPEADPAPVAECVGRCHAENAQGVAYCVAASTCTLATAATAATAAPAQDDDVRRCPAWDHRPGYDLPQDESRFCPDCQKYRDTCMEDHCLDCGAAT